MPRPRIGDFDRKAQEAAFLKAERKLSQDAIAKILKVSQSAVSRLLERAKQLGCFREVAQFVRTDDIDEPRMKELAQRLEHSELADRVIALEDGREQGQTRRLSRNSGPGVAVPTTRMTAAGAARSCQGRDRHLHG